jgi:hypothetical protein
MPSLMELLARILWFEVHPRQWSPYRWYGRWEGVAGHGRWKAGPRALLDGLAF